MRKINLEKILQKNLGYSAELIKNTKNSNGVDLWKGINDSMLEFGQQLLKLAAENAIYQINPDDKGLIKVANESILNTIKQVE